METTVKTVRYASEARPWLAFYDKKFWDMEPPACTVFDYLCQQNKGHLTDIALSYYGNTISYADLIVNVKKTAAALRAIGISTGSTLAGHLMPVVSYSAARRQAL